MKKLFLTTTALSLLAAGAAYAEGPTVTVGGRADFQAGFQDSDSDTATIGGATVDRQDVLFQNDTEIHFKVEGKADNGLGYGAVVELEADVDGEDQSTDGANGGNADKTYLFVESGMGRVELGTNVGASETIKVDAGSIARAAGGINGNFYEYVDLNGSDFIITPDLQGTTAAGAAANFAREDAQKAAKITYYSPRLFGLQAGVSYAPDTGERGTSRGRGGEAFATSTGIVQGDYDYAVQFDNLVTAGVNYQAEFAQVGVEASATGQIGNAETGFTAGAPTAYEDLEAYALGLKLSLAGFSLAGSWADNGDSGQVKGDDGDSKFWTVGGAYEFGPFGVSVTYLDSKFENDVVDNEFKNLSVGADYQLAPGLVPYVEVNFFESDDGVPATADNDGSVVIVGTQLNF